MELSGLLVWAAVLVSLIAFIVFLVKGFQNWGVWMTIGFVILFIECWTFLIATAGVNKLRLAATKEYDALSTENVKLIEDRSLEFFGSPTDPNPDKTRFMPLASELNRMLLERGRTWRGAELLDAAPARMVVKLPTGESNTVPDVPAPDGAPAAAAGRKVDPLTVESVVYAFGEDEQFIPRNYLGEFKVTTVTGQEIVLVPTGPLTTFQANNLTKSRTWAIYEVMPVDSHTAFAQTGSESSEDELFGHMEKKEISDLLQIDPALETLEITPATNVLQAIRARVLQSYLWDGKVAPPNTPLEQIFSEVKFLKEHSERVDSTDKRNPTDGGYFDISGRSTDARLMRGEETPEVTFQVDDVYVLYGPRAKQLEQDGIVSISKNYFVRPLNDYEFAFRDMRRLTQQLQQDAALVVREIAVIDKSERDAKQQQLKYEQDGRNLELDKTQYAKELAVITEEQQRLQKELDNKKNELRQIYSEIVQIHSRLVNVQTDIFSALGSVSAR